jgi:hypothetical protein
VPLADIASAGPLTHVFIGNSLGCQIAHAGDAVYELFPSGQAPGDCGTLLAAGGVLYAPDFPSQGTTANSIGPANATAFTPVSQTPVTGTGSAGSPFRVVTVVTAGASGLRITETDGYVIGDESYRTDVTIANSGGAAVTALLYRAGDCYLQGTDSGAGFIGPQAGAVGCSANANNAPAGRIEQWLPISGGNTFLEDNFRTMWSAVIAQMPFANTCMCNTVTDNAAGIEWPVTIPAGGQVTLSHYTTFSPTGATGPPPSTAPPPTSSRLPPAFGPNGVIQIPPATRCLSKRHFKIHIRKRAGLTYVDATVFLSGRSVGKVTGPRLATGVDLRGLPQGTFTIKIVVVTGDGRVIQGNRTYHTCAKRRLPGHPHFL